MNRVLIPAMMMTMAGMAAAQCDVYRLGIPDFDQRRDGSVPPGGSGLPGGGDMYCVPTGMLNLMAYVANRGAPSAMTGGPGNWQSQSEYFRVSQNDQLMGAFMGTTAGGGTGGTGFYEGTLSWMLTHGLWGDFTVIHYHTGNNAGPSPMQMYLEMAVWGSLIAPVYGRYQNVGGDTGWNRTGGHCVTLYRVYDACSSTPNIGIKNPWTGDSESQFVQSAFESQSLDLRSETLRLEGRTRTMWRIGEASSTRKFIDSMMVLRPKFCLSVGPTLGKIRFISHAALFTANNGGVIEYDAPNDGPVIGLAPDILAQNHWVTTGRPNRITPPKLWKFDIETGRFTHLLDFDTFVASDTDRFGNLIALCDGSVRKYAMGDGSVTPRVIEEATPTAYPEAMAIDDSTDDLFTVDQQSRTIRRYVGGSLTRFVDTVIDTPVPLNGRPFLAINPVDASLWLGSEGTNGAVYKLERRQMPSGGFVWGSSDAASHGSMTGLTKMQFGDDGILRLLSGDVIRCYRRQDNGRWLPAPDALFEGERTGGLFKIPGSRTNFDPLQHAGPGFDENIRDPERDLPAGVPDCLADFNDDGFVDFFDYSDYVRCFESGRCVRGRDADVTQDGFIDFFDYEMYVDAFERGC